MQQKHIVWKTSTSMFFILKQWSEEKALLARILLETHDFEVVQRTTFPGS